MCGDLLETTGCWAALWCYKNPATGLSPAQDTFVFKGVQYVFSGLRQKRFIMWLREPGTISEISLKYQSAKYRLNLCEGIKYEGNSTVTNVSLEIRGGRFVCQICFSSAREHMEPYSASSPRTRHGGSPTSRNY